MAGKDCSYREEAKLPIGSLASEKEFGKLTD